MRNGMKICRPTGSPAFAVAGSGSQTAAIVGQGSVEFANATSLSLNGVFTSEFDNYMIAIRCVDSGTKTLRMRLRGSGTDNSTASSYVAQRLRAASTSVSGSRTTSNIADLTDLGLNNRSGLQVFLYGPNLAQPTAVRSITINGDNGGNINDHAFTHNQSVAYDGCSLIMSSGTMTGLVSVYGLVN
jgi:hypothetical protein